MLILTIRAAWTHELAYFPSLSRLFSIGGNGARPRQTRYGPSSVQMSVLALFSARVHQYPLYGFILGHLSYLLSIAVVVLILGVKSTQVLCILWQVIGWATGRHTRGAPV